MNLTQAQIEDRLENQKERDINYYIEKLQETKDELKAIEENPA